MYLSHGLASYNCFIFCMWPTICIVYWTNIPLHVYFFGTHLFLVKGATRTKNPTLKVNVTLKFFLETVDQVGKKNWKMVLDLTVDHMQEMIKHKK